MICEICPRACKVDREKQIGFCGMTDKVKLAKADVFLWEEPVISGKNGSGAIFFSGCNLKCCFCQNYEISSGGYGKEITIKRLAEIFKELEQKGVHNINLVSPTHYAYQIVEALKIYKPNIPVVWNSNGYESEKAIEYVSNFVDIFLVDLKFFDNNLATKYCKAPNYFDYASKIIKKMCEKRPKIILKGEILQSGVIIRHLVMPSHIDDSIKILEWLKENIHTEFLLSLMGQYMPYFESYKFPEINRRLKPIEYKMVIKKAIELKLTNGFTQELSSSDEKFVPLWDLKGV